MCSVALASVDSLGTEIPMMHTSLRTYLAALVLGMLTLGLGGCNILGPAAYLIAGPSDIEAVYKLDPERTAVVFIDDPATIIPQRDARNLVGQTCEEDLLTKKVLNDMVQSRQIISQLRGEKRTERMTIANVGKSVNAKVVIYALVRQFSMSSDGQTFHPTAVADVKVIDAETGERLFPAESATATAFTLSIAPLTLQSAMPSSRGAMAQFELELAKELGLAISRLFYDHPAPEKPSMKDKKEPA